MSKELEALEELKDTCKTWLRPVIYTLQEDRFELIEKALKVYEELKELYDYALESNRALDKKVIELAKKAKALEIIKEKEVNIYMLIWYFNYSTYEYYKYKFDQPDYEDPCLGSELLAQEEYDFLKEVLA